MRQELIKGDRVQPITVCNSLEGCIEKPEFYQQFNGVVMGSALTNLKISISQDMVDSGQRKIVEEIVLQKFRDFECFSLSQFVSKMRENLDPDIFLRIHFVNSITFDRQIQFAHSIDDEIKRREQIMEAHQVRKKQSFLDLATSFTCHHALPTKNKDLINVNDKNIRLQTRVDHLQKITKEFLVKNLHLNQKHEQEKKKLREELENKKKELLTHLEKIKEL